MKNIKRFASVVMVIMMMLSMTIPARAGTINVPSSKEDDMNNTNEIYTAYKIFDVSKLYTTSTGENGDEVQTEAGWAYSIASDNTWVTVLQNEAQTWVTLTLSADGSEYIIEATDTFTDEAGAKAFAAWLLENKPETVTGTVLSEGSNDVEDGYYLITSSLGSALALTTTDVSVDITEKNTYPTLTKTVSDNEAQIGDTVVYTITVTVPATVDKALTVHDTIEDGLSIDAESFAVKVGETALTKDSDYTVTTSCEDGCSFEVVLSATDAVKGKTVVITYDAELDKEAEINSETNDNTAWLTYSNYQTPVSTVKVTTYQATVIKVITGTSTQIEGAEFSLYTVKEDGTPVDLVDITAEGASEKTYRVADSTETTGTTTTIVAGKAVIQGLDSDVTYYLEETKAPSGYNMLNARAELKVTAADETGANVSINIENSTGTELPSTGGIGTTIFYCAGAVLAVGAFVLLITKKRMSREM